MGTMKSANSPRHSAIEFPVGCGRPLVATRRHRVPAAQPVPFDAKRARTAADDRMGGGGMPSSRGPALAAVVEALADAGATVVVPDVVDGGGVVQLHRIASHDIGKSLRNDFGHMVPRFRPGHRLREGQFREKRPPVRSDHRHKNTRQPYDHTRALKSGGTYATVGGPSIALLLEIPLVGWWFG
jgi:hypothetical protein